MKMEHERKCYEFKSEIDSFKQNDNERFAFYEEKIKSLEAQLSKLNDEKTEILGILKKQKDDYNNLQETSNLSNAENESLRENIELLKSKIEVKSLFKLN
jgi:chromosome segregation ATPase